MYREIFTEFSLIDVAIKSSGCVGFLCQKSGKDPMEPKEICLAICFTEESGTARWGAIKNIGQFKRAMLTYASSPDEKWVILTGEGDSFVAGGGQKGWEKRDLTSYSTYLVGLNTDSSGKAVAVGSGQACFVRQESNSWECLKPPHECSDDPMPVSFCDYVSISDSESYAVGGGEICIATMASRGVKLKLVGTKIMN